MGRIRRVGLCNAELAVRRVIRGVEPLEEDLAVDEIDALAGSLPGISNDEVDLVCGAPNLAVQLERMEISAVASMLVGDVRTERGQIWAFFVNSYDTYRWA